MFLSAAALAVVIACMLAELALSRRNERLLVARGAVEPPDPVYNIMRWAYPGTFVAMAAEGAIVGRELDALALIGVTVLAAAKLLKFWAIATLGTRWTYRVLVIPGAPRITSGPYRWMRHPNYAGVIGELLGMGVLMAARLTGPISLLFFSLLLRRRILAEERALGVRGIYWLHHDSRRSRALRAENADHSPRNRDQRPAADCRGGPRADSSLVRARRGPPRPQRRALQRGRTAARRSN